jgi:dienelactone hydrolase
MKPQLLVLLLFFLTACAAPHTTPVPTLTTAAPFQVQELETTLPAGTVKFDLYLPASTQPAPLIVVAHGFLRTKTNMAGWGQMLATEGFVAAVPTLPAWSDHPRNARAIGELTVWLCATPPHATCINPQKIGLMGFSAGGLSTLLAAADHPNVKIWVGLDPVDRDGMGLAALPRLHAQPVILRAEPSSWNAQGNSRTLIEALGMRCQTDLIPDAIHIDAEWPTDALAELACGQSSDQNRAAFASHALTALKATLLPPRHGQ